MPLTVEGHEINLKLYARHFVRHQNIEVILADKLIIKFRKQMNETNELLDIDYDQEESVKEIININSVTDEN